MKLNNYLVVIISLLTCSAIHPSVSAESYIKWLIEFNSNLTLSKVSAALLDFILIEGAFNYDQGTSADLLEIEKQLTSKRLLPAGKNLNLAFIQQLKAQLQAKLATLSTDSQKIAQTVAQRVVDISEAQDFTELVNSYVYINPAPSDNQTMQKLTTLLEKQMLDSSVMDKEKELISYILRNSVTLEGSIKSIIASLKATNVKTEKNRNTSEVYFMMITNRILKFENPSESATLQRIKQLCTIVGKAINNVWDLKISNEKNKEEEQKQNAMATEKIRDINIHIDQLTAAVNKRDLENALTLYGQVFKLIDTLKATQNSYPAQAQQMIAQALIDQNKEEDATLESISFAISYAVPYPSRDQQYKAGLRKAFAESITADTAIDMLLEQLKFVALFSQYQPTESADLSNYQAILTNIEKVQNMTTIDKQTKATAQDLAVKIKKIMKYVKAEWLNKT